MQTIFDRIDRILVDKKMSRRKLARLAGIPETTLASAFSRRPNKFPVEYTQRIAAVLDVPLDSLIEVEYTEDGPRIPPTEEEERKAMEDSGAFFADMRKITLNSRFDKLNDAGQQKAVDYVSDLADHPRYSNS